IRTVMVPVFLVVYQTTDVFYSPVFKRRKKISFKTLNLPVAPVVPDIRENLLNNILGFLIRKHPSPNEGMGLLPIATEYYLKCFFIAFSQSFGQFRIGTIVKSSHRRPGNDAQLHIALLLNI